MKSKKFLNGLLLVAAYALSVISTAALASTSSSISSITTYFHNDVSGSPIMATDANGLLLWRENYQPYGSKLEASPQAQDNNIGFHGKPHDNTTGLSYMGARYYDPLIGRFTGVDPVLFTEESIYSFNRYSYANNNPYKYVDPNGRFPFLAAAGLLFTGGTLATVSDYANAPEFGAESQVQSLGVIDGLSALPLPAINVTAPAIAGVMKGQAGRFADLAAKGLKGDQLTPHHMPQAALGFTSRADGGALVMPHAEHLLTRTYAGKGITTLKSDADLSFRTVLAKDIRDVRSIGGKQYNAGIKDLLNYYRNNFPELMAKPAN